MPVITVPTVWSGLLSVALGFGDYAKRSGGARAAGTSDWMQSGRDGSGGGAGVGAGAGAADGSGSEGVSRAARARGVHSVCVAGDHVVFTRLGTEHVLVRIVPGMQPQCCRAC